MASSFHRPRFILGVERSGSTWLANIVDAHPESQLYMEPFAPRIEVFPDFPDRLVYLAKTNRYLRERVRKGIDRLERYKYPRFHRRDESRLKRFLVYRVLFPVSEFTTLGVQMFGFERPLAHLRFKNLNKNRIENPELNRLSKTAEASLIAVKELRLNFKVGVIADLWPESRTLVIVRNPLSQIASILRLLRKGMLHDLRAALHTVVEHARGYRRFDPYEEALASVDAANLVHRVTAYWFLNYAILLEDLARHDLSSRLIRHEDLCQAPQEQRRAVLEFLGLPDDSQTERYVQWSTQSTNQVNSVMDTQRDSESYYLEALREVDDEIRRGFWEAAEAFWPVVPAPLRAYRDWLGEQL